MIERLIKYLVDFALKNQYSISIPSKCNEEDYIKKIIIDLEKKDIKMN